MNILPLTLLDPIVVIANTSDQRVPNRRALQSITMASCRSPYIMQRIECPLKWYLRVCTPVLYTPVARPRLWGFAVWRVEPPVGGGVPARRCVPETPLSATCAFRIRRCVHLDKLAALNLTSFISSKRRSNASPWNVLHVRETISGLRVVAILYSHGEHVTNAVDQSIRVFVPRGWTNYAADYGVLNEYSFVQRRFRSTLEKHRNRPSVSLFF